MDECSNLIYDESGGQADMGQSDSKGARKRSSTPSGRGAAMSFGFRKRSGAKVGAVVEPAAATMGDKNGNGGSTEELCTGSPVLSGRSTPLARPRKEATGQPLRTNRFGFRQSTTPKTAKVADVNISAEQALHANQETKNNNDKITSKPAYNTPIGLLPTQVGSNGLPNVNPAPRQTKQTVILTYSAKQYPVAPNGNLRSKSPAVPRVTTYSNYNTQRSVSASRAYTNSSDQNAYKAGNVGKYTFQTNQLPKPQYPAVKVLDTKTAKQVANNSRKVYGSSDGSSKEGSVTEDSGVSGLGDNGMYGDRGDPNWSPQHSRRLHRRPRTLEMIMQGDHNFQLRDLQVNDLDIMDEAIITDNDVIPLPKLPSTFDKQNEESSYFQIPENRFSSIRSSRATSAQSENQENRSYLATLERYRTNRDRDRSVSDAEDVYKYKGEEKASRDRIQHEKTEKQDYNKMSSVINHSPLTRDSSKESSPSTKSEESHPSSIGSDPLEAWVNQTAGESMALRSQDDISAALSLSSSCDDDKGYKHSTTPSYTPTNITIIDKEPTEYASLTTHPMMLKSLSLSQHSGLQNLFMSSSITSSAYSADTSSFINNDLRNLNLYLGEGKLGMATLNVSNHSLIEDETSPADSLISSSTDSNNDMPIMEKDVTVSTSAYHTADNKTLGLNKDDDETCMEDNIKDKQKEKSSNNKSPDSPDTPTNASNSLSLSEGRDFLIDDEIADQPALIFEGSSVTDQGTTSSLQLLNIHGSENTTTLQENNHSINRSKGMQGYQKINASPLSRHKRSPSLDTLSPCDSIASDDLIMDMDLNHSITSLNSVDEYIDRLDGSIRSGLNSLEDTQLRDELLKLSLRKYSSQVLNNDSVFGPASKHQTQSNSTSNNSINNIGAPLPVRTGRLLTRSRAGTPDSPFVAEGSRGSSVTGASAPGGTPDDALRLERATHGTMLSDIVTIKTMLLKLKRVLQEPDEELNMTRTETLNPLDTQRDFCPLKNGPSLRLGEVGEASPPPPPPAPHEEVADLRRQLVFLQSQLEERERMVKLLQQQMTKYSEQNSGMDNGKFNGTGINNSNEDTCNVATQTERLRPTTNGTSILHSLNSDTPHTGSVVSWNEQNKGRTILSPSNFRQSSSSPSSTPLKRHMLSLVNSPIDSDCETASDNNVKSVASKTNLYHRDVSVTFDTPVQVKNNCRVGSKYLQAIASKQNPDKNKFQRSKSIENFGHHNLHPCRADEKINKRTTGKSVQSSERSIKHHASHTNLFDNHTKYTNGYHKNDYSNGNMTDTDDNSDSGYKSLPPSINLLNHGKISGIPRRTLTSELRIPIKQAQTNQS